MIDKGAELTTLCVDGREIPVFTGEYWTSKQRQAASIHEVSYRACFKPQLPRFFITRLTKPGDVVYDPFSGRGTTVIEAALLGRRVVANDVNPLSRILSAPRLIVPAPDELEVRLASLPLQGDVEPDRDLSMFYHPETLAEILALRAYLEERVESGAEDRLDQWIRMIATNRLTGHSPGFFSVYTLPPNQATNPASQRKINEKRGQTPPYRSARDLIVRKSKNLTRSLTDTDVDRLRRAGESAVFLTREAESTPEIPDAIVQLTVTSPPFLDIVQYRHDNWLRCWFNGLDADEIARRMTMSPSLDDWRRAMLGVFRELHRITRTGGWVAFEVGEVRKGKIRLEEAVVPVGVRAGFTCEGVFINQQQFTKTANIWGMSNNARGTNTNRIALFRKLSV